MSDSSTVHVLHVDDDPELADLTSTHLERHDRLTVATVTDVSAGLDYLAANDVDCVVSDYEMPGRDGIEFLETVRDEYPELPFILFTGKGSEEVASEAIAADVTSYLQKEYGTEQYEMLANRITNAVEQYRATHRATNLDRIYRVYSEISRVVVRAESRTEIEQRVCEILTDADPYRFAWFGVLNRDTQRVEPSEVGGIEEGYLDAIEIPTDGNDPRGPTERAVRTREVAVVQDIETHPEYEPWRKAALDRSYHSSAAVPLVYEDTFYGVLNVYADRPRAFDQRERMLLTELGDTVAHAIFRTEIQTSHERYERLVEQLPVGVYRARPDQDGAIVDANPAMADVFGLDSVDAVTEHDITDFYLRPSDHDRLLRDLRDEGQVRDRELPLETGVGTQFRGTVTALRTEDDGDVFVDGMVRKVTDRDEQAHHVQRFRSAVEHAGHVVLITDTDGTIEFVNDTFETVTGYDATEAIGRSPAMLQSGEHDQEFYREMWETILAGEVWQGEVVNERKDGDRYVIDQTIAPITDADGDITGFVACNRDITARKRREQNLAFLKRAIDQAGIGIATHSSDGYATYVNQRLAELCGTDRDAFREHHITEYTTELERDRFETFWESFDEGERRIFDTHIKRVDTDEEVPVEIIGSHVSIGTESYQVSTVRDVSEHKQRADELKRFRSAVEHAGHGVVITDAQGTIEYVNDAFEAMSGYTAAQAIGNTPALLRSGAHDQEFYREMWETILAGEVWQGEVVNERKDGDRYVIDQTIAPITDADGEITGFVAINRDITDLKSYERELEAQNERLKQYGQTVAHDLRNPLTLLNGEIDRLRALGDAADGEADAASLADRCDSIEDVVRRMEALIDDLLTMAEQGQLVLEPEPVDLETVATEAWRQVETAAADIAVESTAVDADRDRLIEMLSNLFRNAVEHGGSDVRVRLGPLDFEGGFFVEDDGPGIPPEKRDRVLDRGFTTDEQGTGYGLAIVEEIAAAHGWDVSVTEGRSGGARFEFRLEGDQ